MISARWLMLASFCVSALVPLAHAESGNSQYPFDTLVNLAGDAVPGENDSGVMVGDGRWTLVMIWATDCHVCKQQKPQMSAFHDGWAERNAHVVGIALDGAEQMPKVLDYLDEHTVTFPNYVGNYLKVAADYQALTGESLYGTPTYLLFDPAGELRGNNPGPLAEGAIERFIARHEADDIKAHMKGSEMTEVLPAE